MEVKRVDLNCDVLIAGGGIGGLTAAVSLKERRPELDILIIEKQTAGYSGKANKGGGVLQYFNDNVDPMDFLEFHAASVGCYLGDQELMLRYVQMNHEMLDILSGWGVNVPKNEDGKYNVMPTGNLTSMICVDLDITLQVRKRAEKIGIRIMDKTPLAELFTDNGRLTGAAAYSILDGTFYVISAKSVILATGSQNYRIASMWSSGRGDGIAAAYRAGAEMRNAEFGNFAQLMKVGSHNEVVFGENYMYNSKGEFITRNFRQYRESDINSNAIREWLIQMKNGNGPVYLDMGSTKDDGDVMEKLWNRPYGKKFREINDSMGAKVDKDNMEVCPLFIGEQSPIRVDNGMRTTINGLYAVGDCCYAGSAAPGAVPAPPGRNRGSGILNAVFAGIICAETLAEEVPKEAGCIGETAIAKSAEDLFKPLERISGHRAKEVIALIQKAMAPMEQSVYMEQSRMEKAEEYIKQAEKLSEELYAEDLHDLLACHEAVAMILSAKMHYAAAKMRKESRGWFLREDYPDTDNENWLKWIIVKNQGGNMTLSTEDVPIEKWPVQPLVNGCVPVTDEEKQSPIYKYFQREMTAPEQSRYDEVEFPVDPELALKPEDMNRLFDEGYLPMEKGYCRMSNGALTLANLTYMPGVTPEMFDWWFAWHGVQPLRYKIWNREQHYYCRTRNMEKALDSSLPMKNRYWDTVHDVVEDCNLGKEKLIINFRNPVDIGFDAEKLKSFDGTIVCAGNESSPMIMCHFLRPIEGGCELRTRFWLGYSIIGGKPVKIFPDDAQIPTDSMKGLLMHNIKEFTNLASFLPEIYEEFKDKFEF